jgi:ketosteroid isomerase-like protein
MSQENIEVARKMLDAWNTGGIEVWLKAFHPDIEFSDHQAAIGMRDQGRGLEELRLASEQWTEIFDNYRVAVLEVTDLGGDYVMAEIRFTGIGHDSGASVRAKQIDIYRVLDGKIREYHAGFRSRPEALAAVGLRE